MSKNIFILLFISFTSSTLLGQNFTQIFTGDIVNDGGWNYACCWADFNGDGFDDLFVCNNDSDNGKHNFLYFNNGDGTFTKCLAEGDLEIFNAGDTPTLKLKIENQARDKVEFRNIPINIGP